ncbi:hypothetical protein [Pseudomonas mediterranea]
MPVFGTEVLDELLKRIHESQSEVIGEDVAIFERLLAMGLVQFNGEGGPDCYTEVSPTRLGTMRVLDPTGELQDWLDAELSKK